MFKTCNSCHKTLPITEFYKSGTNRSGDIKYSHECKTCRKAREMQRYYEKKDVVDELKTPCVHCGLDKHYLIEFHHRDPNEKEFVIAHWRKKSEEALVAEIKKCDCLCKNCHEEFHYLHRTTGISYDEYIKDFKH